jgi:hypothetical protein
MTDHPTMKEEVFMRRRLVVAAASVLLITVYTAGFGTTAQGVAPGNAAVIDPEVQAQMAAGAKAIPVILDVTAGGPLRDRYETLILPHLQAGHIAAGGPLRLHRLRPRHGAWLR